MKLKKMFLPALFIATGVLVWENRKACKAADFPGATGSATPPEEIFGPARHANEEV